MEQNKLKEFPSFNKIETLTLQDNPIKAAKIFMGHRVCDNCGESKDTYGGKTCSKGHFHCHSCASRHVHCTICGHTLR